MEQTQSSGYMFKYVILYEKNVINMLKELVDLGDIAACSYSSVCLIHN